jgi:hypothetical protein
MTAIGSVLRSANVLNGLLLAAIAAVVHFAVIPALNPAARMPLPPAQESSAPSVRVAEPYRSLTPGDYAVISDQTLFHPNRKIPAEKPAEKAVPKPDLFLYGTLITGEGSFAFVEDRKAPSPAGGRDKRQFTLRKGGTLGGYLLSEIEADRIVLIKGDERVVVMLSDREKRRASDAPAPQAASRPVSPSPQPGASLPQTASPPGTAAGAVTPSLPRSPQPAPFSSQTGPSHGPGVGGSGTWPPTRDSVEQTRQKLQEAQQMRREQLRSNPAAPPQP